jgi:bacterioferritin-associated ferredoxin
VFACICRAVTTDQVTTAIDSGAVTVTAVARATRACTGCGTCLERIMGMIEERTAAQQCPLAASQLAAAQAAPMAESQAA